MARIILLPEDVRRKVRSGAVVASLAQIAEELVCNSIDAGATTIHIQLDAEAMSLCVKDDGRGMTREDLAVLGTSYATSKISSISQLEAGPQTLGFRGEAVHAIMEFGLVDITTNTRDSVHTYRKICKGGKVLSLGLASEQRAPGTTVSVRDIFYNQPVRRRQLFSRAAKEVLWVRERILRLALVRPLIAFCYSSSAEIEHLLRMVNCRAEDMILPTVSSAPERLSQLVGAPLDLQKVDLREGMFRVSGYVSSATDPAQQHGPLQYTYVNRRYFSSNAINRLIKRKFAELRFCSDLDLLPTCNATFILNIECPFSEYDITFDPDKTYVEFKDWEAVLSSLGDALSMAWGTSTGYQPRAGGVDSAAAADLASRPKRRKGSRPWQRVDPTYKPSHPDRAALDQDLCSSPVAGLVERPRIAGEHLNGSAAAGTRPRSEEEAGLLPDVLDVLPPTMSVWGPTGLELAVKETRRPRLQEAKMALTLPGSQPWAGLGDDDWLVARPDMSGADLDWLGNRHMPSDLQLQPIPDHREQSPDFCFTTELPDPQPSARTWQGLRPCQQKDVMKGTLTPEDELDLPAVGPTPAASTLDLYGTKDSRVPLPKAGVAASRGEEAPQTGVRMPGPRGGRVPCNLLGARGSGESVGLLGVGALPAMPALQHGSVGEACKAWRGSIKATKVQSVTPVLEIQSKSGALQQSGAANGCSVVPQHLSRDALEGAAALQQVEKKFIPAISGDLLLLVDQHAADERVLLEDLRQQIVMANSPQEREILPAPATLHLNPEVVHALETSRERVEWWGWTFKSANSQVPGEASMAGARTVPGHTWSNVVTLFSVPKILGTALSPEDLQEYAQQLLQTSNMDAEPPAVVRLLASKACRGAIMFGDTLLPSQCQQLLTELKKTRLSFQCAHGRPTLVPLVDLEKLRKEVGVAQARRAPRDLGSSSILSSQGVAGLAFHGLRQHEVSLDRLRRRCNGDDAL